MIDNISFDIEKILKWNKAHASIMLVAACVSVAIESLHVLSIAAFLSFGIYVYNFRRDLNRYRPFAGYANWITLLRLLTLLIIGFFWSELSHVSLFLIFSISILSDVLDGYLARKLKLSSDFGLYLDMETDAFLVSIMSFILWESFGFHWVVLLAGFLRYLYVVILLFINGGLKKEPKRFYASFIAGFFFVALLLPFLFQSEVVSYILYLACILIIMSFVRSSLFQFTEK